MLPYMGFGYIVTFVTSEMLDMAIDKFIMIHKI